MTEEQANEIIQLLKSIDSRLNDIESNTTYNSSAHDELMDIKKILNNMD